MQILGLESGEAPAAAARHCVEAYLRLKLAASERGGRILWLQEPEIEVLATGQTMIPRVVPDKALNETYNASRRTLTKTIDATDVAIQAVSGADKTMLQAADLSPTVNELRTLTQVDHALHIPTKHHSGVYIVSGHTTGSAITASVLTIASSNTSIVAVEPECILYVQSPVEPEGLVATADQLFVQAITILARQTRCILLYEPEKSLAAMASDELAMSGTQILFVSSRPNAPVGWTQIHPRASKRSIQRVVPHVTQIYVDCSESSSAAASRLQECIAPTCKFEKLDADLLQEAFKSSGETVMTLLETSYAKVHGSLGRGELPPLACDCEVVQASEIPRIDSSRLVNKKYVIDWQKRDSLVLTIQPLNLQSIFKPNETYLMAGMAGGLGLSLCQWMIRNGAKNLVITSRNPKIDAAILEDAERAGATVRVLSMDVTSRDSVESTVRQIQDTMPPIAGVCNAAMILSDKFFIDMTVDELNNTLAPKVYGTENLDSIFLDVPLVFFVCLSSVATTIGNIGQANYHAANVFMTSLVAPRRARGLAASVIHVGYITDVATLLAKIGTVSSISISAMYA